MTRRPAKDVLVVFIDGEERPGFTLYHLATRDQTVVPLEFELERLWRAETAVSRGLLHGDRWQVVVWDVAVIDWPAGAAFRDAVRRSLQLLVDNGARAAWMAAEGFTFCDPPALFDPACMDGALAYARPEGRFVCHVDPDAPLQEASAEEMLALRAATAGLSDAT